MQQQQKAPFTRSRVGQCLIICVCCMLLALFLQRLQGRSRISLHLWNRSRTKCIHLSAHSHSRAAKQNKYSECALRRHSYRKRIERYLWDCKLVKLLQLFHFIVPIPFLAWHAALIILPYSVGDVLNFNKILKGVCFKNYELEKTEFFSYSPLDLEM